jgi:lycopene cyclase domain-containing protein
VPTYTLEALVAVAATVAIDLLVTRMRVVTSIEFWVTWVIVALFQIPVDGWLTKLSAPIVIYNPHDYLGIRFPWSIPIEDFAYGFALALLTVTLWRRLGPRNQRPRRGIDS